MQKTNQYVYGKAVLCLVFYHCSWVGLGWVGLGWVGVSVCAVLRYAIRTATILCEFVSNFSYFPLYPNAYHLQVFEKVAGV